MTLNDVKNVFLGVLPKKVFHYKATGQTSNYIVWQEDGADSIQSADDKVILRAITGSVDYFTKTEYDPIVKQLEQAMNESDMSWYLESIQYEEDTGYIHYEWNWEVGESIG